MLQILPDDLLTDEEFDARMVSVREVSKLALQKQSHGRPKTILIRVLSDPVKEEKYVSYK